MPISGSKKETVSIEKRKSVNGQTSGPVSVPWKSKRARRTVGWDFDGTRSKMK